MAEAGDRGLEPREGSSGNMAWMPRSRKIPRSSVCGKRLAEVSLLRWMRVGFSSLFPPVLLVGGGTEVLSTPRLDMEGKPVACACGGDRPDLHFLAVRPWLNYGTIYLNLRRGETWVPGCSWGKEGTCPECGPWRGCF